MICSYCHFHIGLIILWHTSTLKHKSLVHQYRSNISALKCGWLGLTFFWFAFISKSLSFLHAGVKRVLSVCLCVNEGKEREREMHAVLATEASSAGHALIQSVIPTKFVHN